MDNLSLHEIIDTIPGYDIFQKHDLHKSILEDMFRKSRNPRKLKKVEMLSSCKEADSTDIVCG